MKLLALLALLASSVTACCGAPPRDHVLSAAGATDDAPEEASAARANTLRTMRREQIDVLTRVVREVWPSGDADLRREVVELDAELSRVDLAVGRGVDEDTYFTWKDRLHQVAERTAILEERVRSR